MKDTKKRLLSSIATLCVCFAMFIGSTYAWFTDSASTGVNKIQAGNLDIVLEYYDSGSWEPVSESTMLFDDSALWEPGHTEVAYLHIKNAGSLDLKYKMNVNIPYEKGSINQKDEAFKLSNYLVFGKIPMSSSTSFYTNDAAGRDAARTAAGSTMGLSSWTKAGNLYANPIPTTAPAGSVNEEYIALVIYMPETVGNEANHKVDVDEPVIKLGVNIVATQLDSESDSFGNDYDENADGNPDNGAAWTMAAFRAVADVPADLSSGMTITKYENDIVADENKIAEVTIPASTASSVSLSTSDKVALSVVPAEVPDSVTVGTDEVAFNYDIKLMKVAIDNTETAIASVNNPVTVKLNVGKGLSGVKIYHSSTDESGNTTTTIVSGVSYDSSTGIATFTTTSFSDYTVVYSAKAGTAHYTLAEFNALTKIPEDVKTVYLNIGDVSLANGDVIIGNKDICDIWTWDRDTRHTVDEILEDGRKVYMVRDNDTIYSSNKAGITLYISGSVKDNPEGGLNQSNSHAITFSIPDASNVVFTENFTVNGYFRMNTGWADGRNLGGAFYNRTVKSVLFDHSTFNGIWIQNGGFFADSLTLDGCTFNAYENNVSANDSNPLWFCNIRTCDVTVKNCTFKASRPIKVVEQGVYGANVTITGNKFDMSLTNSANDASKPKNDAIMFSTITGDSQLGNVVVSDNEVTGANALLAFFNPSQITMENGATFKVSDNNLNGAKLSVEWKTTTEYTPDFVH